MTDAPNSIALESCPALCPRRVAVVQGVAWLVSMALVVPLELQRITEIRAAGGNWADWFVSMNIETTPFFILLLIAPWLWWWQGRSGDHEREKTSKACSLPAVRKSVDGRAWFFTLVVFSTSLGTSLLTESYPVTEVTDGLSRQTTTLHFGELPPAYHDEYSYLFQAETYLAGRFSYLSNSDVPEIFDQIHVLNEGRFASRYFPGTGLWMAPFVALGHPYWGHWLAGALAAVFYFWATRELAGNFAGLVTGMMMGLSPGLALFSNLLLAHHPCLLGLGLFTFAFLRSLRTGSLTSTFLAGCGLSFAMLCRPMTAAGYGLPFGIVFLVSLFRSSRANGEIVSLRKRLAALAAISLPLLAGFVMLGVTNRAVTGSIGTTPYQLYTDTYTPRHVYGFDNVIRGEQRLGPKVLENYDRWAENLTWPLALENVKSRLFSSWLWTLAMVPLVIGGVVGTWLLPVWDRRWWLVPAAIVSLHAVHVPYWFDGIMHWHYVFETAPAWLMLFGGSTALLFAVWNQSGRRGMKLWWGSLVAVALLTAYVPVEPLWPISKLEAAVSEVAFSRLKHYGFERLLEAQVDQVPALVLVEHDPDDRHIDYINNPPDLKADILVGRFRAERTDLGKVQQAFPDRTIYLYRVKQNDWRRIQPGGP